MDLTIAFLILFEEGRVRRIRQYFGPLSQTKFFSRGPASQD